MELGPLVLECLAAVEHQTPTPAHVERASREFGEAVARWCFGQWVLRRRGQRKFALADKMLFDVDGLEMSTHEAVARFHATQFPPGVRVADLTCGIGADLIALGRDHRAIGFEVEPHRASFARHNLEVHQIRAEVVEADCLSVDWDFDYAFADPSRRSDQHRTHDPEEFHPRLDALAERMSALKLGLIKVSPMLRDDVLRRFGKRVDFVSFGGECREALLRLGTEVDPDAGYWAARVETGQWLSGNEEGVSSSDEPEAFLLEADPAAIRAHLLPRLATLLGGSTLGDSNGYLTAAEFSGGGEASPWVRSYLVEVHGHADPKRIRAELRSRDAFVKVAKVRAAREDPADWVKKIRTEGRNELVLILYPVGKSLRFALAKVGR